MPLTTDDVPDPTKKTTPDPEPAKATPPKAEPAKAEASKSPKLNGLVDAALSTDPLVQKLLWDRGQRCGSGDAQGIAVIDDELRKLGFDL